MRRELERKQSVRFKFDDVKLFKKHSGKNLLESFQSNMKKKILEELHPVKVVNLKISQIQNEYSDVIKGNKDITPSY